MNDKPKIKVHKADSEAARLRSGLLISTDDSGRERYRTHCDRCETNLTLRMAPKVGDAILCRVCREIEAVGKPGTVVVYEKKKRRFRTPCDECGTEVVVSFLPKQDRPFTCAACHQAKPPEAVEEITETAPKPKRHYRVRCGVCRTEMRLRFKPNPGERLLCTDCFEKASTAKTKTRPRLMYNIQCVRCGRKQTLDVVPRDPDNALCTNCMEIMRAKRRR
ncbi:MAG: hypothetical protein KDC35_09245 [Acidobacteria bacterium]|nr:hypothetical protein [Acidobacteriota bacterium]